ncbi:MAG: hypothetical protein E7327_09385 [Clostridiales bacterium]|nr:hypothetical protein [Clostridiales bacterium]
MSRPRCPPAHRRGSRRPPPCRRSPPCPAWQPRPPQPRGRQRSRARPAAWGRSARPRHTRRWSSRRPRIDHRPDTRRR